MSECSICGGVGWVFSYGPDGETVATACQCKEEAEREENSKRVDSRLEFASIPSCYANKTFSDFKWKVYSPQYWDIATKIALAVKYWRKHSDEMMSSGRGLYFWSNRTGSGKTLLASILARNLIDEFGFQVKFTTSETILREIKRTWQGGDSQISETKLIDSLASVEILFIDDFGFEADKEWINERFYSFLNARYIHCRPTFITSNTEIDSLRYDERIVDRIRERCIPVHFPEESVRRKIAVNNIGKITEGG